MSDILESISQYSDLLSIVAILFSLVSLVLSVRNTWPRFLGNTFLRNTSTIFNVTEGAKSPNADIGAYLEVLRGDELLVGRQLPIFSHTTTPIGRDPEITEIVIQENYLPSQISRRHCEIFQEEDRFGVRDLLSSNGTYLNGRRLEPFVDEFLSDHDQLELGPVERGGILLKFILSGSVYADEDSYFDEDETEPK